MAAGGVGVAVGSTDADFFAGSGSEPDIAPVKTLTPMTITPIPNAA